MPSLSRDYSVNYNWAVWGYTDFESYGVNAVSIDFFKMGLEPGTAQLNRYNLALQVFNKTNNAWSTVETKTGSYNAHEQPTVRFFLSNKLAGGQYRIRCYGSYGTALVVKMFDYDNGTAAFLVKR